MWNTPSDENTPPGTESFKWTGPLLSDLSLTVAQIQCFQIAFVATNF